MVRNIGAVVFGVIGGMIAVGLINRVSSHIYGAAEYIDQEDTQALAEFIQTLPVEAFLLVIVSNCIGAFMAGVITSKLAENNNFYLGLISVFVIFTGAFLSQVLLPSQPSWMLPANLLATALLGYFGAKIGSR